MKNNLGISEGGEQRLLQAIEQEVTSEHQVELAAATDYWQRVTIEDKITQEVKKRMESVASSQSLW